MFTRHVLSTPSRRRLLLEASAAAPGSPTGYSIPVRIAEIRATKGRIIDYLSANIGRWLQQAESSHGSDRAYCDQDLLFISSTTKTVSTSSDLYHPSLIYWTFVALDWHDCIYHMGEMPFLPLLQGEASVKGHSRGRSILHGRTARAETN